MAITLRSVKGSALTQAEHDANHSALTDGTVAGSFTTISSAFSGGHVFQTAASSMGGSNGVMIENNLNGTTPVAGINFSATSGTSGQISFGVANGGAITQQMLLTPTTLGATVDITAMSATAIPAGGTAGSGIKVSSTANFGVFFGSGVPTLSAAQGSLYMRSDGSSTSTRMYVNTNGTTGWTNVVTAA